MIEWRESLEIDHGGLDRDHREQHDLIRRFIGTPATDEGMRAALHLLRTLRRVSERHFIREERVQAAVDYPGRIEHRAQHRRLLEMLDEITEQMDQTASLFDFAYRKTHANGLLEFWFFDHFARADVGLRRHLARFPLPRPAASAVTPQSLAAAETMHQPQGRQPGRSS
ncbi:hemerythrin-like metal-binding protein [Azospirillum fermentarium]|uniref:bacteriohemerythrin n=1 Tax=Azospirillum fermentarium TaxID=1233114 RepID=UPI002226A1C7|nr:hemerythrin family protein [Azospirillum fermentarium]MCW2247230.1 hemerythrin-like metal-binding protein [Azospirillum fermentarium]